MCLSCTCINACILFIYIRLAVHLYICRYGDRTPDCFLPLDPLPNVTSNMMHSMHHRAALGGGNGVSKAAGGVASHSSIRQVCQQLVVVCGCLSSSVCLFSVCFLSVFCLFSVCLCDFFCLPVCLSVCVCLSMWLSLCVFVCLSVCMCVFVCLCLCLLVFVTCRNDLLGSIYKLLQ